MVVLPLLLRGEGRIGLGWTMRSGAVGAGGASFAPLSRSWRLLLTAQCRKASEDRVVALMSL
jgi:hypothetical protein